MTEAYFDTDDGIWFRGTDWVRGPWLEDACHAGPPTGLVVRALEREIPDKALVRVMVEITRPVPMGGFRVETERSRVGRSVATTTARIVDDDRVYATASALHMRRIELDTRTADVPVPDFATSVPGPFPVRTSHHGKPTFAASMEMRYDPSLSIGDGGPTMAWARCRVPLLEGEEPSPVQRVCPLADCGNGISHNDDIERVSFVNADLLLSIHRPPHGEWIGSRSVSHWQPSGIGMADAELFDVDGPIGRATQNLLLDRVGP